MIIEGIKPLVIIMSMRNLSRLKLFYPLLLSPKLFRSFPFPTSLCLSFLEFLLFCCLPSETHYLLFSCSRRLCTPLRFNLDASPSLT